MLLKIGLNWPHIKVFRMPLVVLAFMFWAASVCWGSIFIYTWFASRAKHQEPETFLEFIDGFTPWLPLSLLVLFITLTTYAGILFQILAYFFWV